MIVQFQNLTPRLSQEDIIRKAQQEEDDFVIGAIREHLLRVKAEDEQRRQRIVNLIFGCCLGLAIVGCAALVLFLANRH